MLKHRISLDLIAIAGMTAEKIEQQRQQFGLSGLGPGQAVKDIAWPLVEEPAPCLHLMLEIRAEFDPVDGIEPLDRHGMARGRLHEGPVDSHAVDGFIRRR